MAEPAYIEAYNNGLLKEKVENARQILDSCHLCPRKCLVNRNSGQTGICKTGRNAVVASYCAHMGEEMPLVGRHGSGTIFFSNCSLLCIFCQNYDISHHGNGIEMSDKQLSDIMLSLQNEGCHNINFVTPTHVVPQILSAVHYAVERGLHIPLIYNTSGYDNPETIKLLDHVVDIFMPDIKFSDPAVAEQTCDASNYPVVARVAVKQMHKQVGDLVISNNGVAERGLLVRHLVLPKDLAGTREIMNFISGEISNNTYINIMPQYRPCGRADEMVELSTSISQHEYDFAVKCAVKEGLTRIDKQKHFFL